VSVIECYRTNNSMYLEEKTANISHSGAS